MSRRLLFIYNDSMCPEALLGEVFSERGFEVDVFDTRLTERTAGQAVDVDFPDPTGYDALVPLGSRRSVYEPALVDTWVGAEMDLVRAAAATGVGVLGVCFGGQLVAQAFGGTVERGLEPELGWYEIGTDATEFITPGPWFEWHFDRWALPPESASSPAPVG